MSQSSVFPQMLSTKQAAAFIGVGESTLEKLRVFGGGPKYLKLGNSRKGRVVYDPADLQAWLETRKRQNTSQQTEAA